MTRAGQDADPSDDSTSTNRCGGSNPSGRAGPPSAARPAGRAPPGRRPASRSPPPPSSAATAAPAGVIAPGRVCQANTSAQRVVDDAFVLDPHASLRALQPFVSHLVSRSRRLDCPGSSSLNSPLMRKTLVDDRMEWTRTTKLRDVSSGTAARPARVLATSWRPIAGETTCWCSAWPAAGVPVGWEVAAALQAPLDVFLVRKLGVPQWQELAMGALATGGGVVVNDNLMRSLGISDDQLRDDDRPRNRRTAPPRAGLPGRSRARGHRGQDRDPRRRRHRHRCQHARRGARGAGRRPDHSVVVAVPVGPASACRQLARRGRRRGVRDDAARLRGRRPGVRRLPSGHRRRSARTAGHSRRLNAGCGLSSATLFGILVGGFGWVAAVGFGVSRRPPARPDSPRRTPRGRPPRATRCLLAGVDRAEPFPQRVDDQQHARR